MSLKKIIEHTLIGFGAGIGVLFIILIILVIYVVGGSTTYKPESVEYHNFDDLYRITNVRFPNVELVGSDVYADFVIAQTTLKFVLSDSTSKPNLIRHLRQAAKSDSIFWKTENDEYEHYIQPDEYPVDRPNGKGWRKNEDGALDHNGNFIRMTIQEDNDTIILQYGWQR